MVRQARPDDSRGGRRLGRQLRREARGERPEFSAEFQTRLMRRIEPLPRPEFPAGVGSAPAAAPGGDNVPRRGAWPLAAAVAVVLAIVAVGTEMIRRGPPSVPATAAPPAVAASQPPGDHDLPGIETLPTFDEIEQGLRDGVKTLAASLVEVPDWASLADFDAAALLGGSMGP